MAKRCAGTPIPSRVRVHDPLTARTTVLEIERIDFGPIPESQFTVSAYGLPELGGPPQGRRENRLAFMLIFGAIVAFFLALALKYFAKRLGRPVSSP